MYVKIAKQLTANAFKKNTTANAFQQLSNQQKTKTNNETKRYM